LILEASDSVAFFLLNRSSLYSVSMGTTGFFRSSFGFISSFTYILLTAKTKELHRKYKGNRSPCNHIIL